MSLFRLLKSGPDDRGLLRPDAVLTPARRPSRWDPHYALVVGGALLILGVSLALLVWRGHDGRPVRGQPAELTLDELAADGPPEDNAFVRVTNCTAGPKVVKAKSKGATDVFIPFFGERPDARGRRPMIVVGTSVSNDWDRHEEQVRAFAARTEFTGLVERRRLQPRNEQLLREAYPEQDFTSVWVLEERAFVMTPRTAKFVLAAAAALVVLSLVPFWLYFRLKWRPPHVQELKIPQRGGA
jgi:hypothetical protein